MRSVTAFKRSQSASARCRLSMLVSSPAYTTAQHSTAHTACAAGLRAQKKKLHKAQMEWQ
jgi:hypothetical protein